MYTTIVTCDCTQQKTATHSCVLISGMESLWSASFISKPEHFNKKYLLYYCQISTVILIQIMWFLVYYVSILFQWFTRIVLHTCNQWICVSTNTYTSLFTCKSTQHYSQCICMCVHVVKRGIGGFNSIPHWGRPSLIMVRLTIDCKE